jgi:hypothetical protein
MKYTIHEDPQLAYGISYENAPTFVDGDIVELINADGSSHLFMVRKTEGDEANCKYCEAHKATSCLSYWFSCVGTHLKQLDKIMEDL